MEEIILVATVVIGLPWLILHYVTKWKTGATITSDDEQLLEDLFQMAKRLDDRMETVERLVAEDNIAADDRGSRQERISAIDAVRDVPVDKLEEMLAVKKGEMQ